MASINNSNFNTIPSEIITYIINLSGNPRANEVCKLFNELYQREIPPYIKSNLLENDPLLKKITDLSTSSIAKIVLQERKIFPDIIIEDNLSMSDKLLYSHSETTKAQCIEYNKILPGLKSQRADLEIKKYTDQVSVKYIREFEGAILKKDFPKLIFKNIKLHIFPPILCSFSSLIFLDFSNNNIKHIPEDIELLENLYYLNLSNNKIETIPSSFFKLKKLLFLVLHQNKISEIPKQFGNLHDLTLLSLTFNKIKRLPPELSKITSLRMSLEKNELEYLHSALKDYAFKDLKDSIFDLEKDIDKIESNQTEELPKRLRTLLQNTTSSTPIKGSENHTKKKIKLEPKNALLTEMQTLLNIQNGFEKSPTEENFRKIVNFESKILHPQQIIEVAIVVLNKMDKDKVSKIISRIAKETQKTESEAKDLLWFHPTDPAVKEAIK